MHQAVVANTLGALALAVVDGMDAALAGASRHDGAVATALNAIGFREDCSIRELAGVLALTHSGTVRCVDSLCAIGLLERGPGHDARTVALRLTATGRARWAAMRRARMAWLSSLLERLSVEERNALGAVADTLLPKLAPEAETGERICRLCDESICTPANCPISRHCAQ